MSLHTFGLVVFALIIGAVAIAEASELRCRVCWRGFALFTDRRCRRHRVQKARA